MSLHQTTRKTGQFNRRRRRIGHDWTDYDKHNNDTTTMAA